VRDRLVRVLEKRTGKSYGHDLRRWRQWESGWRHLLEHRHPVDASGRFFIVLYDSFFGELRACMDTVVSP